MADYSDIRAGIEIQSVKLPDEAATDTTLLYSG